MAEMWEGFGRAMGTYLWEVKIIIKNITRRVMSE